MTAGVGPLAVPPPRRPGAYAVELVCSGNICRSPSAHVVLAEEAAAAGLDAVVVTSSGIGGWHVGQPMDQRSAAALEEAGFDPTRHRARQVDASTLADLDLVLAMDRTHLADLLDLGADPERTRLFTTFDPVDPGRDVPDPYYGGPEGFQEVLAVVRRTSVEIVGQLSSLSPAPSAGARP